MSLPPPTAPAALADLWNDPTLDPLARLIAPGKTAQGPMFDTLADGRRADGPANSDPLTHDPDNPLLGAAQPLLLALAQLRAGLMPADAQLLRDQLIAEVRRFQQVAAHRGVAEDLISDASQLLCTALDEAVASTPWARAAAWASHSLLVTLHGFTDGGDRVFLTLEQTARDADPGHALLPLYRCVLALGLKGRFRVAPHGEERLCQLRRRLRQLVDPAPAAAAGLSPTGLGLRAPERHWRHQVPIWVMAVALALLWCVCFAVQRARLAQHAGPGFRSLTELQLPPSPPSSSQPDDISSPVVDPSREQLQHALADDVAQGRLELVSSINQLIIRLPGDTFFASGSPSIRPGQEALLSRVAAALGQVQGTILISGHTDARPISNSQFSSNWDLSRARAENVRNLLLDLIPSSRLKIRGLGGMDPIADNGTVEGRARNRRVDITLLSPMDEDQP
ncbi:type VI secretion system protein ImpK [Roseateles sp. YR242]|uniref:type IVB secretion system protein IcmH/DotU n=1 Tax=Roseateles sp. YR242 TaxID=1855305 RepID=UPI0008BC1057|nr:type IVB secretion system protein IcmH/DotU [Roseateles sp. YR242]SEK22663.1 type VI secretion system protein ImpK [Roseateles sp. YR242]